MLGVVPFGTYRRNRRTRDLVGPFRTYYYLPYVAKIKEKSTGAPHATFGAAAGDTETGSIKN